MSFVSHEEESDGSPSSLASVSTNASTAKEKLPKADPPTGSAGFRKQISEEEMDTFVEELTDFCTRNGVQSKKSFDRAVWTIRNKMKLSPSKRQMVDAYLRLTEAKRIPHNPTVEHQMVGKGLGKGIVDETQNAQASLRKCICTIDQGGLHVPD
uniref:Uncharacterized protein n=1 Tax=Chromera velia CCMP2878 TaxID=1169474 RepID=A0A0G4HST5_9ALVE|eukprot:Cvel_31164.t1-p1 / transcript=Cvel_31164.t1 / gene=Cvel_31164 / organism=Chromera_velia_CCMP2878 / gene_product=hypothetical protein / transcript_product=hypothetical protein / location=Cvel_scaffold4587:7849-8307(+) / protein_length=153 / sequence_SO=supercontig / SO=protein_coding / is_pseudo=false